MKKPLRTPLFQQVADILREEIEVLPSGTRLETDQGLARRFSVSVSVIREAVSLLRRDGLVERYVGRGTFVAAPEEHGKAPQPQVQKPVAILFDPDISKIASSSLLRRVQDSKLLLEERGFETAIHLGNHILASTPPTQLSAQQFLKDLQRQKFAGVLASWAFPSEDWMAQAREDNIPVVGFGHLHENMVSYDFEAFIKIALKALKERNRTRIAYINGVGEWNLDNFDIERRKRVFALFQEAGVEIYPHWFKQDWHPLIPGAAWSQFREVWTQRPERPDGIIVGTPRIWREIELGIESFGLNIGEDLDVVLSNEGVAPKGNIISVQFDTGAMISAAVALLSDLLAGKTPASTRLLIDAWGAPSINAPLRATSPIHPA